MGIKVVTTLLSAALSSYDLATLAVVKDELNITNGSKDVTLKRYITSASAAAVQYCNRKFQQETLQDEFWPDREPQYVLPGGATNCACRARLSPLRSFRSSKMALRWSKARTSGLTTTRAG